MVTQSSALSRAQRTSIRDLAVQQLTRALWLPAALALGACSSLDFNSFRAPDLTIVAPRTTATLRETPVKPVTAEDLVGTDGTCAGVPTGRDPNIPATHQDADIPMVPSAVALDMTECDVVKRAGHPEKVDFSTNERGERTVVLTYTRGARPGVYRFAAGRLTSIERVAEPPPPPPRQQQRKPPRRTT